MDELIETFVARYPNPKTAQQYESELSALFAFAGVSHRRRLSEAAIDQWVGRLTGGTRQLDHPG